MLCVLPRAVSAFDPLGGTAGQLHRVRPRRRPVDSDLSTAHRVSRAPQGRHGLGQLLRGGRPEPALRRHEAVRQRPRQVSPRDRGVHRAQNHLDPAVTMSPRPPIAVRARFAATTTSALRHAAEVNARALLAQAEQDQPAAGGVPGPPDQSSPLQHARDPGERPFESPASSATYRVPDSPHTQTTHSTTNAVQVRSASRSTEFSRCCRTPRPRGRCWRRRSSVPGATGCRRAWPRPASRLR